ncbi:MAG: hypothetical protein P8J86_09185 [Phycisphaerales bacterium]|nr:hypothetical protein [Phycisphaerales bacterium]
MAIAGVFSSCSSSQSTEDEFTRAARLTTQGASDPQERLRDELGEFMVYFERTIARLKTNAVRAADGNAEQLETIRSLVMLIELKFTEAYAQPDSFEALIELWYDAYRLNAWRWQYEKRHSLLVSANGISHILNRIREIARRWTQPSLFGQLDGKIREQARLDEEAEDFIDPERMRVSKTPVLINESKTTGLVSVLGLPFAPFAAVDSISRTAAEMGLEARRIADRVDRLPSDLGHQGEMIVLEVLSSPQVGSVLKDLEQLSVNFARISDEVAKLENVVDQLPTRVREESLILLESLDGQSEELLTINDSLLQTFESGGQTLDSLAVAITSLNELTLQVETTTLVLDEMFGFSTAVASDPGDSQDTLVELKAAVDGITEASISLQNLISSPEIESVIDRVDRSIKNAAKEADQTASMIVNLLAWRLGLLLVIAFVLGAVLVWFMNMQKRRLISSQ